jgi:hypothetical protein
MTDLDTRRAVFVYETYRLGGMASRRPIVPEEWDQRDPALREKDAVFLAVCDLSRRFITDALDRLADLRQPE